jgi:flagellar assembly protein FliH
MNTSSENSAVIRSFRYPSIAPLNPPAACEKVNAERELRLQRANLAAIEAARAEGMREGKAAGRAEAAESFEPERAALQVALQAFAHERELYFHRVEEHVVKLAMAIARKVLHREAQVDPLLLSAVVRVALEQVQAGSQVRLHTGPADCERWRNFFAAGGEHEFAVQVVEDAECPSGTIRLETSSGRCDFSIEGTLQEIENGFFDLLAERSQEEQA